MKLPTHFFDDFLVGIRLTQYQLEEAQEGHKRLRHRLDNDEIGARIINTFIQGSYKRSTAIRPSGEKRSDVDVVVVTNLHEADHTPEQAIELFIPFVEKHYKGKYERQGRSIGIELSTVELDLVITSAPSESQKTILRTFMDSEDHSFQVTSEKARWKSEPLRIPNRDTEAWEDTNPLEQIRWTVAKNKACNGHYVNVVKAIKWWQRINSGTIPRPKGYPLEHMIGDCCPDGISSIEEGVLEALKGIVARYHSDFLGRKVPTLHDRGVANDVMKRITAEEFADFYVEIKKAAEVAQRAFNAPDVCETIACWRQVFGSKFPPEPEGCKDDPTKVVEGFSERENKTNIGGGRYA